jgi:hypothetical protein
MPHQSHRIEGDTLSAHTPDPLLYSQFCTTLFMPHCNPSYYKHAQAPLATAEGGLEAKDEDGLLVVDLAEGREG